MPMDIGAYVGYSSHNYVCMGALIHGIWIQY